MVQVPQYTESKKRETRLWLITSPNAGRFLNSFTDRLGGKFAILN